MRKIIFLCHGNICRSPMAEFIFKDEVRKINKESEFEVTSKALSSEEIGNDIYPKAKDILRKHNVSFDEHMASKFSLSDYDYYDEIYVMDESNLRIIHNMIDDKDSKIKLLNGIIEDPWYTRRFDKVFEEIKEGVLKIINA